MLDSRSRNLLLHLIDQLGGLEGSTDFSKIASSIGKSEDYVQSVCNSLEGQGYVKITPPVIVANQLKRGTRVTLTTKGLAYPHDELHETHKAQTDKRREKRKEIREWIAIVLSVVAIAISIIALLRQINLEQSQATISPATSTMAADFPPSNE